MQGSLKKFKNEKKIPWIKHNLIIKKCFTLLLCGKRLGQPWSHLVKIIALKMYKPLKKSYVLNYLFGKMCKDHKGHIFTNIGLAEVAYYCKNRSRQITLCNLLLCKKRDHYKYHFMCPFCFYPYFKRSYEIIDKFQSKHQHLICKRCLKLYCSNGFNPTLCEK